MASVTTVFFQLLIACFILDVIIKLREPKIIKKKEQQISKKEDYDDQRSKLDLNLTLDEDEEEDFKGKNKKNSEKNNEGRNKKSDEDEEEEKKKEIVLLIKYDKKQYQKHFLTLKADLISNFSSIEIEEKEYPLNPIKEKISKFTFISQIGLSALIFGGTKMKDSLTFIPPFVFESIEKYKWGVVIFNFLFHHLI